MSEVPYDPYIPNNGASATQGQQGPGNQRTAAIQQQIDDTVGIMRENINKVADRGARLDSLQDKTDNLAVSAQGFRRGANRVRKQMWWKDMKMRICLVVGIIILLVIIIVPVVLSKTWCMKVKLIVTGKSWGYNLLVVNGIISEPALNMVMFFLQAMSCVTLLGHTSVTTSLFTVSQTGLRSC